MKIPGELLRKMLSILKKKSKTGLAPELEPWLERPDKIKYTIDTRPAFQSLLSSLLIAVDTAVLELLNKKHKCLMKKGRDKLNKAEEVADAARQLDYYAKKASNQLRLLAVLLDQARPIIQAHLLYLKQVFAITEVKVQQKQTHELTPSPLTFFDEIDATGRDHNWDLAALKYLDLVCCDQRAVCCLLKVSRSSTDAYEKEYRISWKLSRLSMYVVKFRAFQLEIKVHKGRRAHDFE